MSNNSPDDGSVNPVFSVGTEEGGIKADVLSGDERNEGTRIFLVTLAMFMLIAFLLPRRGVGGGIRAGLSSTRSMHSFWLLHVHIISGSMLLQLSSSPSTMQLSSSGTLPLSAPWLLPESDAVLAKLSDTAPLQALTDLLLQLSCP